jgi:hypothetical protein
MGKKEKSAFINCMKRRENEEKWENEYVALRGWNKKCTKYFITKTYLENQDVDGKL